MGLDEVKKDIMDEAEARVNEILLNANKEAEKITKDALTDAEKLSKQDHLQMIKDLDAYEKRELALANLDARKMMFECKKERVSEVIDEAKKQIISMPSIKKKALFQSLLDKARKEIDARYIYCNKQEAAIIKDLLNVKETLEVKDMGGGIIIENKEKTIMLDYCYDTVLKEIREEKLQEIAKILF
jgi:V/A-type H+-transporting ATPase subunit E